MFLLFKNYLFVEVVYLLIRFKKVKYFLWNTNCTRNCHRNCTTHKFLMCDSGTPELWILLLNHLVITEFAALKQVFSSAEWYHYIHLLPYHLQTMIGMEKCYKVINIHNLCKFSLSLRKRHSWKQVFTPPFLIHPPPTLTSHPFLKIASPFLKTFFKKSRKRWNMWQKMLFFNNRSLHVYNTKRKKFLMSTMHPLDFFLII